MSNSPNQTQPVFVIAEACDNHFGRMDYAKEMILRSKLAGADAVKFQHHLPDEEMLPEIPMSDNFEEPLYEFLKKNALKLNHHIELDEYCQKVGIEYMCTPFSYKAACEIVEHTSIKRIKIGSGEMTDVPSLVKMTEFGLPMIVSTGMSTFEEIDRTYQALKDKTDLSFTYCISEYPPVYEDMNLGNIPIMTERYPQAQIGHSDHTPDLYTSFAAVTLGARIVEKHVILDKRMPGPDQSVSIDFNDLASLVDGIRKIEVSLGTDKKVHKKEEEIRAWAFRSVVAIKEIKKGETISQEKIWSKRPGTGIPSHKMDEIIGKIATKDIEENSMLSYEDFEG